jgi:pimeloyl-ACP methyl ester carboxylesterase
MEPPIRAYRGDAPYVFVCYSHADTDAVYRDIVLLSQQGLNIWYDEGISPGTEWSEELAQAINNASLVIFYASSRSSSSRHCRDEINFAHNHDKQVLAVHLEDVSLPAGLELSLSSTQAIMKHRLSDEIYLEKMKDVLPSSAFGDAAQVRKVIPPMPASRNSGKKVSLMVGLAMMAVLIVAYAAVNRDTLMANFILLSSEYFGNPIEQEIGFATTSDNMRIAYGTTGDGPPIVIVLGWATHLQKGMMSPAYDDLGVLAMTAEKHRVVQYDGRGFGLSDREVSDYSVDARVRDIEAVVDALGLEKFVLYAMSAGGQAGVAYTHRHPDKVVGLVLASTYLQADTSIVEESWLARLELMKKDWDSAAVRNLLFDTIFPNIEGVQRELFAEFIYRSADGDSIHGFFSAIPEIDVRDAAKVLEVPTLVIHGRDDDTVPLESGRVIASLVRGAKFEVVDGGHGPGTGMTPETRRLILDFIATLPAYP